jgi:hypothetical protein
MMSNDKLPPPIAEAIADVMSTDQQLFKAGFEQDEFGQFAAECCSVTVYQVGAEYEVDIRLPHGSMGFDVSVKAVHFGVPSAPPAAEN